MKRTILFLVALVLSLSVFGAAAFAEEVLYQHGFSTATELPTAVGKWEVKGGRLYQTDPEERLAKINVMVPQSGEMQYEFDVRYEDGGFDDRMGGFGIHIAVNEATDRRSWGNGKSHLLWLNYDENPSYGSKGFMAQVYKSDSPSEMDLVGEFDLNRFARLLSAQNAAITVKVRLKVNSETGSVWLEDPTLPGYGYAFSLGGGLGTGTYVSLRTNSLSLSFDNLKVTRLK